MGLFSRKKNKKESGEKGVDEEKIKEGSPEEIRKEEAEEKQKELSELEQAFKDLKNNFIRSDNMFGINNSSVDLAGIKSILEKGFTGLEKIENSGALIKEKIEKLNSKAVEVFENLRKNPNEKFIPVYQSLMNYANNMIKIYNTFPNIDTSVQKEEWEKKVSIYTDRLNKSSKNIDKFALKVNVYYDNLLKFYAFVNVFDKVNDSLIFIKGIMDKIFELKSVENLNVLTEKVDEIEELIKGQVNKINVISDDETANKFRTAFFQKFIEHSTGFNVKLRSIEQDSIEAGKGENVDKREELITEIKELFKSIKELRDASARVIHGFSEQLSDGKYGLKSDYKNLNLSYGSIGSLPEIEKKVNEMDKIVNTKLKELSLKLKEMEGNVNKWLDEATGLEKKVLRKKIGEEFEKMNVAELK